MSDLSEDRKRLIQLAYERSSTRLDAQLNIAMASDQRSLVFAGLSVAAAAFMTDGQSTAYELGSAGFFLVSAILSALSALPQGMHVHGAYQRDTRENIDRDDSSDAVVLGLAELNDEYIDANENKAHLRTSIYGLAVWLFVTGCVVALLGVGTQLTE